MMPEEDINPNLMMIAAIRQYLDACDIHITGNYMRWQQAIASGGTMPARGDIDHAEQRMHDAIVDLFAAARKASDIRSKQEGEERRDSLLDGWH